jgi:hypothetical protein
MRIRKACFNSFSVEISLIMIPGFIALRTASRSAALDVAFKTRVM